VFGVVAGGWVYDIGRELFQEVELEGMGMVRPLVWVVVWYVAAKVLEWKDWEVYRMIGVGGHTLKHLAAGVSAGYFVVLFRRRRVGVR